MKDKSTLIICSSTILILVIIGVILTMTFLSIGATNFYTESNRIILDCDYGQLRRDNFDYCDCLINHNIDNLIKWGYFYEKVGQIGLSNVKYLEGKKANCL